MSESAANERMQKLVGELLYENQILRNAMNIKDEYLRRIAQIAAPRETPACICEAERQLANIHLVLNQKRWNQEIRS
jgi:hypothetical protein